MVVNVHHALTSKNVVVTAPYLSAGRGRALSKGEAPSTHALHPYFGANGECIACDPPLVGDKVRLRPRAVCW